MESSILPVCRVLITCLDCRYREFRVFVLLSLFVSGASVSCFSQERPNIVLFYVDDLGWSDLGYMGSSFYESPTIDSLAKRGMIFTNAYANAPNCAPSRASMMSGLYTPRHGVYTVAPARRGKRNLRKLEPIETRKSLDPAFPSLPRILKENGYVTAQIGKWHLGNAESTKLHGFDYNIAGYEAGHPPGYFSPYGIPGLEDGDAGEYLTDRLTYEAVSFIERHSQHPFFLYLSHYAVHTPIQAKPQDEQVFLNKTLDDQQDNTAYAAMIKSVDRSLRKVVEKLSDLGIAENTLVIFYSDNGGLGSVTSNKPLKGEKGMLFEGGIRVPMFWYWPEKIRYETACDVPVMGIDIFPTLLEIAGIKGQELDGESLVPLLLEAGSLEERNLFWHFPAYLQGVRRTKFPDELVRGWRAVPSGAIRKGDWKLIEDFETGELLLYNLKEDISEKVNLSLKRPEKLYELRRELRAWRKKVNAPVPSEINPYYLN